jgi:hypothetical protein
MEERSNISKNWYELGTIEKSGSRWVIKDLLVRWSERTEEKETEDGPIIEYIYDAHRFDFELPPEVQPGLGAVEYYLTEAKDAVVLLAQNLLAQEEGFHES